MTFTMKTVPILSSVPSAFLYRLNNNFTQNLGFFSQKDAVGPIVV